MSGRGRGINNAPAWVTREQQNAGPGGGGGGDYYRGGQGGGRAPRDHRDNRGFHPYPPRGGRGGYRGGYGDNYGGPRDRFGGGGGGGGGPRDHRGPPNPRGGSGPPRNALITFRSLQEEREWVDDRRRKRHNRQTKFDKLPTAEQQLMQEQQRQQQQQQALAATTGASSAATTNTATAPSNAAFLKNPQQTRHARRLYVGNLPPVISEHDIHSKFRYAIATALGQPVECFDNENDPILSVYINHERHFCFLEFKAVEMTTACMQLDGLNLNGTKVKIKRPNDFNEFTAPKNLNVPQFDVSKLGIVSSTVLDGPNKIFIGGLHYHLQQEQILELLQAFGKVKAFHLVRNPSTDGSSELATSKGYCFVEYVDSAITPIAIQGLNGMDIGGGKALTARLAGERSGTAAPILTGAAAAAANTPAVAMAAAAIASSASPIQGNMPAGAPPPDRTIVNGYDVEELVDAAMGTKTMPLAPKYVDALGMPLTRIVPLALALANAVQAAQEAAAQAQAQQVVQQQVQAQPTQASQAATASQLTTSGNSSNNIPTRILVLYNMVTDEDLATDDEYSGLMEEVREECANYGQLLSMKIPRLNSPGKGKIYLEYSNVAESQAAAKELTGRQFGDAYVETSYYNEDSFCNGQLQ